MTMDWAVMNSIMAAPNRTCHVTKAPGGQGFGFTLQRQRTLGHSGFHTIGEIGDIAPGHPGHLLLIILFYHLCIYLQTRLQLAPPLLTRVFYLRTSFSRSTTTTSSCWSTGRWSVQYSIVQCSTVQYRWST